MTAVRRAGPFHLNRARAGRPGAAPGYRGRVERTARASSERAHFRYAPQAVEGVGFPAARKQGRAVPAAELSRPRGAARRRFCPAREAKAFCGTHPAAFSQAPKVLLCAMRAPSPDRARAGRPGAVPGHRGRAERTACVGPERAHCRHAPRAAEGFSLPAARKQGRKGLFRQQSFRS